MIQSSSSDGRMLKILHGSDFHFGSPHLPQVTLGFKRLVNDINPNVIVLSGDFTQRAKVEEYRQARSFLDSLPNIPTIVTPGNHDIPLYRLSQRLFNPFRNYQEFISQNLDTVTRTDGAIFVALNSADPYRSIINGRIGPNQLEFAADAFRGSSSEDIKVLVMHHPLVQSPDEGKHDILPGSTFLLESFNDMGVELILSGHVHRAFVSYLEANIDEQKISEAMLIVHSGTTASNRGRVYEKRRNTLNVLELGNSDFKVNTYWYEAGEGAFLARGTNVFRRRTFK